MMIVPLTLTSIRTTTNVILYNFAYIVYSQKLAFFITYKQSVFVYVEFGRSQWETDIHRVDLWTVQHQYWFSCGDWQIISTFKR